VELKNLTFENEPSRNRDSNVKFAPLGMAAERIKPKSGRRFSGKFGAPTKGSRHSTSRFKARSRAVEATSQQLSHFEG
jgi:hypothetical protein